MTTRPNQKVHAFTIKYSGIARQIITELHIAPAFDPKNPPAEEPRFYKTKALWDTGATTSVITPQTIMDMKLKPSGMQKVNHAGGIEMVNSYMVNFILPNEVGFFGWPVIDCKIIHGFGAIIGMDIISKGDFAITNVNNQTWMSFRLPSIKSVDYVNEVNKLKYAGVQRNQICPCGSGKKFKKCCGMNI